MPKEKQPQYVPCRFCQKPVDKKEGDWTKIGTKKVYLCPNCISQGIGPDGYPNSWNQPLPLEV